MLPERRQELLQRRQQLQPNRERQFVDKQQREFLAPLDQAGVAYTLAEDPPLISWITDRFTIDRSTAIDWARVAERHCADADAEAQDPAAWLRRLAEEKNLGEPVVAVVFADAAMPCLTMRYDEFARHVEKIVDVNWQTWVFDLASSWIIEFHHHQGWCWGKSA